MNFYQKPLTITSWSLIQWCYLWERDNLYYLLGYYYIKQYWAEDKTMYQAMLQNIYNAYHYGKSVEIKKEFMPAGSQEQWEKIKIKKIKKSKKQYVKIAIKEDNVFAKTEFSSVELKKLVLKEWLSTGLDNSFENIESYLFDKKPKNDFNLRNNIDHFHYFYGKDGKSIFELYENMYQKLKYDRKLQNNLMQRIEDILQRYHLESKVEWKKSGSELKFQFKDSLKSDTFTMKTYGKPFTADAKTKEFCEVVQKILEYKV